jgi:hypothetical protein
MISPLKLAKKMKKNNIGELILNYKPCLAKPK